MIEEIKQICAYREMLKTTVSKELRARYKGSFLGFFWTFLNPLLQLLVYAVVFKFIMRVRVPGINYTVYLFVNLVAWTCFSSSLIMGVTVIATNANLIEKIYFPRSILPLSSVVGNIVNLLLTMCIVFPVLWISGYGITVNYLYLPVILLLQAILTLGFVLLLSSMYVYFRDLEHIVTVVIMVWMYLSPIIYSDNMVPARFFGLYKMNPLFPVITSYQKILLYGQPPDGMGILYLACSAMFFFILGDMVFAKLQRRFAEEL